MTTEKSNTAAAGVHCTLLTLNTANLLPQSCSR